MNKAFEKILEMLEDWTFSADVVMPSGERMHKRNLIASYNAKQIVQEVAEEYNGGWIPCGDRLPEKNGMYLCTQNSYDLATNKNIIRVSTELVEFYNGKWRRAKNLVITHWQTLPEPFKERD